MLSNLKYFVKLVTPPIFFKIYRRLISPSRKFEATSLGIRPDEQDLGLYWDENYAKVLEEWGKDSVWIEIELIFSTLKGKVLDIACGTGPTIKILQKNNALEVHGFDISDLLIEKAIMKGILKSRVRVADATQTTYLEDEFDYSFSIGSIEHFTEDGIDLFLKNAAYYTKNYSFHMLPVNKDGKDKGWEKTEQSYFNNSEEWWKEKFYKHFPEVTIIDSTWAALDQQGKWFICKK